MFTVVLSKGLSTKRPQVQKGLSRKRPQVKKATFKVFVKRPQFIQRPHGRFCTLSHLACVSIEKVQFGGK